MPTTDQDNNTKNTKQSLQAWCGNRYSEVKLLSKTAIALLFIINSIALGLFALDLVNPSRGVAAVFGAISIAFAAVVLGTFVHHGVKFQAKSKKR